MSPPPRGTEWRDHSNQAIALLSSRPTLDLEIEEIKQSSTSYSTEDVNINKMEFTKIKKEKKYHRDEIKELMF